MLCIGFGDGGALDAQQEVPEPDLALLGKQRVGEYRFEQKNGPGKVKSCLEGEDEVLLKGVNTGTP